METVYDVLRELIKVFGAGEKHDQASAVLHAAEAGDNHEPEHAAPAGTEGATS